MANLLQLSCCQEWNGFVCQQVSCYSSLWSVMGQNFHPYRQWKCFTLNTRAKDSFTTTTNTGNPIAVPSAWQYTFQLKDKKVAFKHRGSRPMMLSTVKPARSERKVSLSSQWRVTRMARSVGTEENTETTMNDTKIPSPQFVTS